MGVPRKIRFGVVGLGHIGTRHARIILAHPGMELLGVADTDISRAQELDLLVAELERKTKAGGKDAGRAGAGAESPIFYGSIQELLDQRPDVLCVCTPNGWHYQHSMLALEAGIHVICEKPVTLKALEARALEKKAQAQKLHFFCVKQNRYSPPAKWLHHLAHQGHLGKIFLAQMNCFWNRDERYYSGENWRGTQEWDGGPLFTQFSHYLDHLIWVLGLPDLKSIRAEFFRNRPQLSTEFEDTGIVKCTVGQTRVEINYSTAVWDCNLESSLTLIGERGSVRLGGQYMDRVEYCHVDQYQMPKLEETAPPNDYGGFKGSASNHIRVFENALASVLGEAQPDVPLHEAHTVVEFIEAIYLSRPKFG